MKNPILLSLVALIVSVVALAALLFRVPVGELEALPVALPGAGQSQAELLARLDALSEETRRLRNQLALLESSPSPEARTPVLDGFVSQEEFEAFRDEMRAAFAERSEFVVPPSGQSDEFEAQVADTLSKIRLTESVEAARSKLSKLAGEVDATMPKITSWLELTPSQSESMRTALLDLYDREADLVRRWEAGEDPELLGETKRIDRETHRAQVAAFLTPQQLETYTSRGSGKGK